MGLEGVDYWEIRKVLCDRYEAVDIVDSLGLTSEELFDILEEQIMGNLDKFELLNRDFDNGYEKEEDEGRS